jgi:hypothetical protein
VSRTTALDNALSMSAGVQDYIHQPLNEEVTAIGGHYVLAKEVRLPFQGREILYLVGYAAFDTSCCGAGGVAYALVPGFILDWKGKRNADGLAISQVEPVHDNGVQEKLRALIEKEEMVQQVRFL